jgi:hypothetical protein
MLEKPGAEEEFPLILQTQAIVIPEMTGNNGMIEGLLCDKALELMFCVEALKK